MVYVDFLILSLQLIETVTSHSTNDSTWHVQIFHMLVCKLSSQVKAIQRKNEDNLAIFLP